jgi:hypothetical protein
VRPIEWPDEMARDVFESDVELEELRIQSCELSEDTSSGSSERLETHCVFDETTSSLILELKAIMA